VEIVLRAVADPSVHWVVRERAEVGRLRELDVSLQDASISKPRAIAERVGQKSSVDPSRRCRPELRR
jgi:hypothetical protein